MHIAIIGAGLAGLTLAQRLSGAHQVTVFEKARGVGGRMSTRCAGNYAFDHGAQYFTAQAPAFVDFLENLKPSGLVAPWASQLDLHEGARVSGKEKLVAVPGMNAICKTLAQHLDVECGVHIKSLEKRRDGWRLNDAGGETHGTFDWVISTAPAAQTSALFPGSFAQHAQLGAVKMSGCFALMLGFDMPLDLPWQALKCGIDPVGWIAVNSGKPGRDTATSLLIQSNNDWAETHLEDDPTRIQAVLLSAASELVGQDLSGASHVGLHRWRYAATPEPAGVPFLCDEALKLAACGDWCLGSKVEAAFLSADALSKRF